MKLWKKWCKKVEKHNKPLMDDCCCWKEIWNPYDIFIPVIIFLIVCFLGFFSKNIIIGFLMGFIFWSNYRTDDVFKLESIFLKKMERQVLLLFC